MRDDRERLYDILDAIENVQKYTARGYDYYLADELVRVWIVHHLQLIGEAASNVSQAVRECYPELPWVDMVSMRNILVHKYFGIDLQEVWDTATIDLPKLTPQIQAILKALKDQQ